MGHIYHRAIYHLWFQNTYELYYHIIVCIMCITILLHMNMIPMGACVLWWDFSINKKLIIIKKKAKSCKSYNNISSKPWFWVSGGYHRYWALDFLQWDDSLETVKILRIPCNTLARVPNLVASILHCHFTQLTTTNRYPALEHDVNGGAYDCIMPAQLTAMALLCPLSSFLLSPVSNMGLANIVATFMIIFFLGSYFRTNLLIEVW